MDLFRFRRENTRHRQSVNAAQRVSVAVRSVVFIGWVFMYRMSGRIIPTAGKGWRFQGFGLCPLPSFNSALELSMAPLDGSFHL